MEVRQLSVFLANEPGSLRHITQLLADAGINIRALSIVDSTDFGLLRLIVDQVDAAVGILESGRYVTKLSPVIVAEMSDAPGGLNGVLAPLEAAGVNLEYIYAFAGGGAAGQAIVLFKFDDNARAAELLAQNRVTLLSEADIAKL